MKDFLTLCLNLQIEDLLDLPKDALLPFLSAQQLATSSSDLWHGVYDIFKIIKFKSMLEILNMLHH